MDSGKIIYSVSQYAKICFTQQWIIWKSQLTRKVINSCTIFWKIFLYYLPPNVIPPIGPRNNIKQEVPLLARFPSQAWESLRYRWKVLRHLYYQRFSFQYGLYVEFSEGINFTPSLEETEPSYICWGCFRPSRLHRILCSKQRHIMK